LYIVIGRNGFPIKSAGTPSQDRWLLGIYAAIVLLVAGSACYSTSQRPVQTSRPTIFPYQIDFAATLEKAKMGDPVAQYNVGKAYWTAYGVRKDDIAAARWLRRAADQNHSGAQSILGFFYANGVGVPQDYVEAYKWEYLSFSQGEASAASALRDLNIIAPLMTPSQINEAKQLARDFKPQPESNP
jgi:TPR repeat protein